MFCSFTLDIFYFATKITKNKINKKQLKWMDWGWEVAEIGRGW